MSNRARFRILWIILGLVIAATAYLIGFNYYNALELAKRNVLEKLKAVTCTASLQIDAAEQQQLIDQRYSKNDSVENSPAYIKIHEQLKTIREVNDLGSPVYTIIYDLKRHVFQYGVTSDDISFFGADYNQFPKILLEKFNEGGTINNYRTERGEWISAFAPIKNSNGKTVALLMADESCSQFTAQAHDQLIKQSILAFVTVMPLVLLLYFYTRRFLQNQKEYERSLKKQQSAIVNQSKIIKEQNRKLLKKNQEIESINLMLDNRVKERTQSLLRTTHELKTYLYRSSHDMRGPISSLLGLCKLMLLEKKVEPYAKMIFDSSTMLAARIQSLREVYEIGSKEVDLGRIDVCQLLEDVKVSLLEEDAGNYILCQDADSCPEITMDKELTKMLLKETVHNAVYHNRTEKKLTHVWVKTHEQNGFLNIEVKDDGIGMNEKVREKAFEMFYRGHELSQGIGLGLFKVKTIVERLNGKLSLDTSKGKGTSIQISLPVAA